MVQKPFMIEPVFCKGSSISVSPEEGRFFLYPIDGMTRAEEQSKVPCVFILRTVGMFAFAVVFRGEYPPLALISIICFPSTIETLFCSGDDEAPEPLPKNIITPAISATEKIIEIIVAFIIF